jgi:transposase InsO family protein
MTGKVLTMQDHAEIALAAADRSINRSALAARLGISRQWLHTLIGRVQADRWDGLMARSRAPKRTRQIAPAFEDEIVRLRKELTDEGMSSGAAVIQWHLERLGIHPVPSQATIWRRLKTRGLVQPAPERAPRPACVRFEFPAPNACWQIDFTHWSLRDGRAVVIVNVIDDHSRLCVASRAATTTSSKLAWQAVSDAAIGWGVPARVLSDNGVEFSSRSPTGGLFETNLRTIGVQLIHSRAHHPQTCGKVERFHHTTKTFLRAHPAARSIVGLQRLLDDWIDRYNHRPHQGIRRRTPHERWHASTAEQPGPALPEPADRRVTELIATANGKITVSPWEIPLGQVWARQTVRAFVDDLDVAIFTTDARLIRTLRINPERRYQPLTNT